MCVWWLFLLLHSCLAAAFCTKCSLGDSKLNLSTIYILYSRHFEFKNQTFDLAVLICTVELVTLTTIIFYLNVPISQHAYDQSPRTGKQNLVMIHTWACLSLWLKPVQLKTLHLCSTFTCKIAKLCTCPANYHPPSLLTLFAVHFTTYISPSLSDPVKLYFLSLRCFETKLNAKTLASQHAYC